MPPFAEEVEAALAVRRGDGLVAVPLQDRAHDLPQGGAVVDDQDAGRHGWTRSLGLLGDRSPLRLVELRERHGQGVLRPLEGGLVGFPLRERPRRATRLARQVRAGRVQLGAHASQLLVERGRLARRDGELAVERVARGRRVRELFLDEGEPRAHIRQLVLQRGLSRFALRPETRELLLLPAVERRELGVRLRLELGLARRERLRLLPLTLGCLLRERRRVRALRGLPRCRMRRLRAEELALERGLRLRGRVRVLALEALLLGGALVLELLLPGGVLGLEALLLGGALVPLLLLGGRMLGLESLLLGGALVPLLLLGGRVLGLEPLLFRRTLARQPPLELRALLGQPPFDLGPLLREAPLRRRVVGLERRGLRLVRDVFLLAPRPELGQVLLDALEVLLDAVERGLRVGARLPGALELPAEVLGFLGGLGQLAILGEDLVLELGDPALVGEGAVPGLEISRSFAVSCCLSARIPLSFLLSASRRSRNSRLVTPPAFGGTLPAFAAAAGEGRLRSSSRSCFRRSASASAS